MTVSTRRRVHISRPLGVALILLGAVLTIAPFYFMFVFASHDRSSIYSFPPPLWFGPDLAQNYKTLLERLPFWRQFWNSAYITVAATISTLFFCSLAGYAFAMFDFRGKRWMFNVVLLTMLIPPLLNLIPFFVVMKLIGWVNTPRALWVPGMASAFGIFLMRQYTRSALPRELIEAARVDGAGEFRIYWQIVLPLVRPALATLGLVTFIGTWNNFQGALVILQSQENYTLPLALRSLTGSGSATDTPWGAVMCGIAITVLPLLIAFVVSSKQLISGLTAGAVKD